MFSKWETMSKEYEEKAINLYSKGQVYALKARDYAINFEKQARGHVLGDKKAQGILEYGIIIAVVSLGVLSAVTGVKNAIVSKLSEATKQILGQ